MCYDACGIFIAMGKPNNPLPSLEILEKFFIYDETRGLLINKINRGKVKAGETAGRFNPSGYLQVRINYVAYYVSRVIWKLKTGEDPGDKQVDHINGNRSDNRWFNLRLATPSQNLANKPKHSGDLNLPKGVYASPTKGKYCACIKIKGKTKHLGTFNSAEEAAKVFEEKAFSVFREYTNTKVIDS